ncbi:electron transport complex subunit A [Clostridia bacterium]|nr:electron transport complex subunit A [Clostridia bacterium]
MAIIAIIVAAVLSNNVVFSQTLGICPYMGVSKKTNTAVGMGIAVIFVMAITSLLTYALYAWVLVPLGIEFLKTIVFIFVIAAFVQLVEMSLKKFLPTLYNALGIYLPLITTNCCVLGIAIVNVTSADIHNIFEAFINGAFIGVGFLLALVLMSGVRERIVKNDVPAPFKGFPIALLSAGIIAMAFLAFSGIAF